MGRKRTVNLDLPPFVHRRKTKSGGVRYYLGKTVDGKRKEIPLGSDYWTALDRARGIETVQGTIAAELEVFKREYLPTIKKGTAYAYERAILRLQRVFGGAGYGDISRADLAKYIRLSSAKVRAKRDIACLSSFWSWALDAGRTEIPNPRIGMRVKSEGASSEPATDEQFRAVYECSDAVLRDVLDLLYLTGQDVRTVLGWRRNEIADGWLNTQRSKTGARLRIEVGGDLASVFQRIYSRPVISPYIVSDEKGNRVTYGMLWYRFKKACRKAGVDFELRAIRRKTAKDSPSLMAAQELLGHADTATTRRHYRIGEVVKPLNRRIK